MWYSLPVCRDRADRPCPGAQTEAGRASSLGSRRRSCSSFCCRLIMVGQNVPEPRRPGDALGEHLQRCRGGSSTGSSTHHKRGFKEVLDRLNEIAGPRQEVARCNEPEASLRMAPGLERTPGGSRLTKRRLGLPRAGSGPTRAALERKQSGRRGLGRGPSGQGCWRSRR